MKDFYKDIEKAINKFFDENSPEKIYQLIENIKTKFPEDIDIDNYLSLSENIYREIYNFNEVDDFELFASGKVETTSIVNIDRQEDFIPNDEINFSYAA